MIEQTGETQRARVASEIPALAAELAEVVLDPPERIFADAATLDLGGREVRLAYLGRGHTDNDIVVLSRTPTSCAPATSSRTARPPTSATATRWTGPRRSSACSP